MPGDVSAGFVAVNASQKNKVDGIKQKVFRERQQSCERLRTTGIEAQLFSLHRQAKVKKSATQPIFFTRGEALRGDTKKGCVADD